MDSYRLRRTSASLYSFAWLNINAIALRIPENRQLSIPAGTDLLVALIPLSFQDVGGFYLIRIFLCASLPLQDRLDLLE